MAPVLLTGDRALLFLRHQPTVTGAYDVQPFTGTYPRKDGKIFAVAGNPFRSLIDGKPEHEVIDMILQLVPR